MKWDIKPNQSRIFQTKVNKTRYIDAIMVDTEKKEIKPIRIENNINTLQRKLDFYKYWMVDIQMYNHVDRLFVSNDTDDKNFKHRKTFYLKGYEEKFYGNAIIIGVPTSMNLERLINNIIPLNEAKQLITFI